MFPTVQNWSKEKANSSTFEKKLFFHFNQYLMTSIPQDKKQLKNQSSSIDLFNYTSSILLHTKLTERIYLYVLKILDQYFFNSTFARLKNMSSKMKQLTINILTLIL